MHATCDLLFLYNRSYNLQPDLPHCDALASFASPHQWRIISYCKRSTHALYLASPVFRLLCFLSNHHWPLPLQTHLTMPDMQFCSQLKLSDKCTATQSRPRAPSVQMFWFSWTCDCPFLAPVSDSRKTTVWVPAKSMALFFQAFTLQGTSQGSFTVDLMLHASLKTSQYLSPWSDCPTETATDDMSEPWHTACLGIPSGTAERIRRRIRRRRRRRQTNFANWEN